MYDGPFRSSKTSETDILSLLSVDKSSPGRNFFLIRGIVADWTKNIERELAFDRKGLFYIRNGPHLGITCKLDQSGIVIKGIILLPSKFLWVINMKRD